MTGGGTDDWRQMAVDWHQPFVRESWEARLVVAGFSLGNFGMLGTALVLVAGYVVQSAMMLFLVAWFGALLLTIVLFRVSKRVLGSYYPLLRPLAMIQLQVRFLGRAPVEAAHLLQIPELLARILVVSLPFSFFSLSLAIVL